MFQCDICPKSFKNIQSLQEHVVSCHGNEEHPCSTCGKVFASRKRKRTHEITFHSDAKFTCDQCEFVSKTNSNLQKHIKVKHDPDLSENFECTFEDC